MRRWTNMLPASVQVCPVEIPGRGRREGEPAPESIASLAKQLARCLPLDVSFLTPGPAYIPQDYHRLDVQVLRHFAFGIPRS